MGPDPEKYELLEEESYEYEGPVAMASGGDEDTEETVQRSEPWAGQAPHLLDLYQGARGIQERTPYGGTVFPDYSPITEEAMGAIAERARAGSPLMSPATDLASRTLGGEFLYGGPGFDAALDAAVGRITPGIMSTFEAAGRGGGGLEKAAIAKAIGREFAGMYGDERGFCWMLWRSDRDSSPMPRCVTRTWCFCAMA